MAKFARMVLSFVGSCSVFLASSASVAQIIPYDSELIEENFAAEIAAHRAIEDRNIRNPETTLLSDDYFSRFTGLNYFPVDIKYRVAGRLTRLSTSELTNLGMSRGTPYGFMRYGKVSFYLQGKAVELQVFEFPSASSAPPAIFVPFRDATSGKESYGGGRFMIIRIPKGDRIMVDFNMAINPICVYDPEYLCPVPPLANSIRSEITAGARMYFDPLDEMYSGRQQ
ncbi:MAG: DUF1684 domain-containing protein [Gammaproteobacteria bacterium]|nr:DUF1684 domain-containing protein [Gammaproteobacteria bacterium]